VPVVVRLEGTNVEKAREILKGASGELPTLQTATDLTDAARQWGPDESQVIATMEPGRQAAMPGWAAVVGAAGVEQLASYVLALSQGQPESASVAQGGALFQQYCAACHGPDGAGNPQLGAPALNDAVWNYGGERADVIESIANGRSGVMPAFGARLDETQIRLLAAWLKAGAREP
jgi:cytochrome c oxidase cbb3-type subunit 3